MEKHFSFQWFKHYTTWVVDDNEIVSDAWLKNVLPGWQQLHDLQQKTVHTGQIFKASALSSLSMCQQVRAIQW